MFPSLSILGLLQQQGKYRVYAVRKLLIFCLLHKINILEDQLQSNLLLELAEPKTRDLEKRYSFTKVIDKLDVALRKKVKNWEGALPISLEDGIELSLEVSKDFLH